jgi:hypothetical protein
MGITTTAVRKSGRWEKCIRGKFDKRPDQPEAAENFMGRFAQMELIGADFRHTELGRRFLEMFFPDGRDLLGLRSESLRCCRRQGFGSRGVTYVPHPPDATQQDWQSKQCKISQSDAKEPGNGFYAVASGVDESGEYAVKIKNEHERDQEGADHSKAMLTVRSSNHPTNKFRLPPNKK